MSCVNVGVMLGSKKDLAGDGFCMIRANPKSGKRQEFNGSGKSRTTMTS